MSEIMLPLPPSFLFLILLIRRAYYLDLIMLSSLFSKQNLQAFEWGMPVFQMLYEVKLKTSNFEFLPFGSP